MSEETLETHENSPFYCLALLSPLPLFSTKSAIVIFNINLPQLSGFSVCCLNPSLSAHLILSEVMEHLVHPAQYLLVTRAPACLGLQASWAPQDAQVLFFHFCLKIYCL